MGRSGGYPLPHVSIKVLYIVLKFVLCLVETSTALPVNSISGRKLRRELLDMEMNQLKQDKLESKLFQNIPFLNM